VEYRRSRADQRSGGENRFVAVSERQQNQTHHREDHADRRRKWLRMTVGVQTDQRLEERGGELIRQGDQTELTEVQCELSFQQGVNRQQQRLHHVVDEMRCAERAQDAELHPVRLPPADYRFAHAHNWALDCICRHVSLQLIVCPAGF
jgi:hypothetical protein